MDNIRNTILLFCILLFFILLFYYYTIHYHTNTYIYSETTNSIPPLSKEPFVSTFAENNTVVDNNMNNNNNNNNNNIVKDGVSYLNSWFKRSCSCAEGFTNAYKNSGFDFYLYTKISKNDKYITNGFKDLQYIEIHPQKKMYYYNFRYRWKEYINITHIEQNDKVSDKVKFETGKGATICFWLRTPILYPNSDRIPFTILLLNLGNDNYIKMIVNTSGLHLLLKINNITYNQVINDLGINNHEWNHISWTMSAITNNWKVFLNGVWHKTIKNQYYPITSQENNTLHLIGTDNGVEFFEGDLGDLRIFNYKLISSQIQDIYNNPATPAVDTNNSDNNAYFESNNNQNSNEFNKYNDMTWTGQIVLEENKVDNINQCKEMCNKNPHCSGATYSKRLFTNNRHCRVYAEDSTNKLVHAYRRNRYKNRIFKALIPKSITVIDETPEEQSQPQSQSQSQSQAQRQSQLHRQSQLQRQSQLHRQSRRLRR